MGRDNPAFRSAAAASAGGPRLRRRAPRRSRDHFLPASWGAGEGPDSDSRPVRSPVLGELLRGRRPRSSPDPPFQRRATGNRRRSEIWKSRAFFRWLRGGQVDKRRVAISRLVYVPGRSTACKPPARIGRHTFGLGRGGDQMAGSGRRSLPWRQAAPRIASNNCRGGLGRIGFRAPSTRAVC